MKSQFPQIRTLICRAWIILVLTSGNASAQVIEWPVSVGGNGHFYQAFARHGGLTWNDANWIATNGGGYLATSTSSAENDTLFDLAKLNTNLWTHGGPWLGAVQPSGSAEPAGGWSWVTGEDWVFEKWLPGQPNNTGGNENRIQFYGYGSPSNQWNDVNAGLAQIPGCLVEYNADPRGTMSPVQPTPVQWSLESGGNEHFYRAYLVERGITWSAADQAAKAMGGSLATPNSEAENDFIYSLVNQDSRLWLFNSSGNGVGPWLGGFQPYGSAEPGGGWQWVTGEPFTTWIGQAPDNNYGIQDHLHFAGWGKLQDKTWNDYPDAPTALFPSPRGLVVEWTSIQGPVLSISHAVEVCWPALANTLYQVQWAPSPESTNWINLGSPIMGNGTTNSIFDTTQHGQSRVYRTIILQ